jgi:hypothetical protein
MSNKLFCRFILNWQDVTWKKEQALAMMTCDDAKSLFNDLLDNALAESDKTTLTLHLAECLTCKNEYETLVSVVYLVRTTPVPDGQPSRARVMTVFRQTVTAPNFSPHQGGLIHSVWRRLRIR